MTGLIFGVIAVAWLAYLLPWFLSHRDQGTSIDDDEVDRFAASMRVIRNSPEPVVVDDNPDLEFSTPLMRSALRVEVARAARTAAARRRVGLLVHLGLVLVGVVAAIFLPVPIWIAAVPVALLALFLVASRVSVGVVRRRLDAKLAVVKHGWDEETISLKLPERVELTDEESQELSIELSGPLSGGLGSLLEPIPVTPATYVSKPLLPRSVRTIDLTAPASVPALPVVPGPVGSSDADDEGPEELPRAVGE